MRVLLDSSIWIDHFRKGSASVVAALEEDNVVIHEAVIGELSMGNIPRRKQTLRDLDRLECLKSPPFAELLHFVETHRLHDQGLGWVDAQLLASAALHGVTLLTKDAVLARAWKRQVASSL
ncbi:MAG: PIN domain-containing protein [Deltaproteobacteria bacterium]|nr:PIN domain-containing protein [Deltaproteobacteria bacterium]